MRAVAYYRVSRDKQGRSGLGLEAQRAATLAHCQARGLHLLAEFTEVESGKDNERPELAEALHRAKVSGAILVIAKLDRLSRNLHFLTGLQESRARFVAADMPEANELTVHIMAAVAQDEGKRISLRTSEALQAAKARGQKLGNPNGAAALRRAAKGNMDAVAKLKAGADAFANDLISTVADIRSSGPVSLPAMAAALNERQIQTRRGGRWHPSSVQNLLKRISA